MSWVSEIKRKAKIAKLKAELAKIRLSLWYKGKKVAYHQWRINQLERREAFLESRSFQRGDEDE